MPEPATTPAEYLDLLPEDRRRAVAAIRETINANLEPRFREGIQYGMIGWFVPHEVYPPGYHCDPAQPLPFAGVASQKNHIGIHLFSLYFDEAEQKRFAEAWKATGKRLDMGKSCIRVKRLEDVPLDVLGDAIARVSCDKFVALYEKTRPPAKAPKRNKASAKPQAHDPSDATPAAKKKPAAKTAKTRTSKAAERPAGKKTPGKTPATKKAAVKKKSTSKKPASKKPAAKKAVSKKVASKKPTAKRVTRKKIATRPVGRTARGKTPRRRS